MGVFSDKNMKRKNSKINPIKSIFSLIASHNSSNRQKQNYLYSIKSIFILKDVFSFLNEKMKLKMIIYNKHLQKILEVDIKNYKKISRKQKLGETNKKRTIKFEGEYLNGKKWNGKVYEYNSNGKLIFESQYLNGRIDGKGKEYDFNGELIFEGEYFNGKRWNGRGEEYDSNGELIFEGEYLKGRRENGTWYK